jgi:hypothetical protein
MKKLLIVLLALTVVGVFAFAQDEAPAASISVGAWGRMWVSPINSDGTNQSVTAGPDWGGRGRVGISFNGSSEHFGFSWNPGVSGNNMTAVCDQAKIWAKISPLFTVQIGKIQGDVLRGKVGDSGDVLSNVGKDAIFKRFYPNTGLLFDITPVEGLYIGAAIDSSYTTTTTYEIDTTGKTTTYSVNPDTGVVGLWKATTSTEYTSASDAYKSIQAGVGYTIKDVGLLRAQYIGSATDNGGIIQAAFAFTGVAGLTVDVGAKIPMDTDNQTSVGLGASYAKDAFSAYGICQAMFAGKTGSDFNINGNAQVYYTVADPVSVGVEAAISGMTATGSATRVVDIFPALKLAYSNGYLKVGFDAKVGLDGQDFGFQVPVQLEYWF